MHPNSINI